MLHGAAHHIPDSTSIVVNSKVLKALRCVDKALISFTPDVTLKRVHVVVVGFNDVCQSCNSFVYGLIYAEISRKFSIKDTFGAFV